MGEQSIKSIARPIRVYALRPERSRGADGKRVVHRFKFAARRCATPVDCRVALSNLSDDREQQYFADEIPEDLTTDLFRLENMFVSARNTAFTYRPIDTKQIGRKPGVRYVLKGSVRRSG